MNNLDDLMDDTPILEGKVITADTIELLPKQVAWAAEASASAKPEARWQNYLDHLALIGIQEWLKNRVPELEVEQDWREPMGYLMVGNFKLFVITLDSIEEDVVTVSKAAINKPEFRPHLYVLVEVLAEPKLVRVCGCLSQVQLVQQQETEASRIEDEDDANYLLPRDWFEPDPAQVLLYLRCIHPSALIQRPILGKSPTPALSIPQVVTSSISRITEKVEQAVQELTLILQPPLQLSSVMRSLSEKEKITTVVKELRGKGIEVPPDHMYAESKEDLLWENVSLRLHVIKWNLSNTILTPKWSLLLILGTLSEESLPPKVMMKIEDATQVLDEQIITEGTQVPYLYTQAIGTWQEQFRVTIQMPDNSEFPVTISSLTEPYELI
ncbi:DUF1822 family protein [Komarekiella sp. 'clone 1']|uniref:DUF1822 family protein n=1 Tax=Komarekiella delphini-convector SJRDD-AB1 TaxID=2593771 RepID=A0AA40VQP3_9NOST|nr:DUF1822 family protein [Komarekiella delphini-convector]MBD6615421.1 DUF1822 family protein [Komarekiella delphini-convector SJRDD-AB1]